MKNGRQPQSASARVRGIVETLRAEPAEELPHFQTTGFKRATFWAGLTGLRTFFLALPVRSRQR